MSKEYSNKRNVVPADAIKSLAEHGIEISENEAELILDFLYFLCKLTVNQQVKNNSFVDLDQQKQQGKSTKRGIKSKRK